VFLSNLTEIIERKRGVLHNSLQMATEEKKPSEKQEKPELKEEKEQQDKEKLKQKESAKKSPEIVVSGESSTNKNKESGPDEKAVAVW
jgi:hypothetical protein